MGARLVQVFGEIDDQRRARGWITVEESACRHRAADRRSRVRKSLVSTRLNLVEITYRGWDESGRPGTWHELIDLRHLQVEKAREVGPGVFIIDLTE